MDAVHPVEDRRMMLVIHNIPNNVEGPDEFRAFLHATLPNAPPVYVRILLKPHLYAFVTFPTVQDRDNAQAVLGGVLMYGHAPAVQIAARVDPGQNVIISLVPEWVGI